MENIGHVSEREVEEKTERMALFRDCYSKSQKRSAYKFILMASPDDGWSLHSRASQEPVHRDRAGMFGGALLGIQSSWSQMPGKPLNCSTDTELQSTHFYLHLPPLPQNLSRVSMEN